MSTHLDGHQFHLPPPTPAAPTDAAPGAVGAAPHDGLEIFDDGDGRLRLVRGTRDVGWLAHRVIGLRGFADADAARAAASAAFSTLSRWLARQSRTGPVPARRRPLTSRHDGVSEWLTLGGVPVGRLCYFDAGDAGVAAEAIADVGFELFLSPRVGDRLQLHAARVVERALGAAFSRAPDRRVGRAPATAR